MQDRKQKERSEAFKRADKMSAGARKDAGLKIVNFLSSMPEFAQATSIMLYVSADHEVDTHGLIKDLLEAGKEVSVPKSNAKTYEMDAVQIRNFDRDLEPGYAKILEPKDGLEIIAPEKLDIVIVPLVAFGSDCRRLGRGKGFYDRFIKSLRPDSLKIGLAFESQKSETVPEDVNDMRLDMIVSEKKIYKKIKESDKDI